ncbi:MAG: hypothetical protein CM15mP54_18450 [Paracoccaceae bacterium]|nr:MAG: hypothetical protein CM15mP54_18450 [Paracoccaceae bacterium]
MGDGCIDKKNIYFTTTPESCLSAAALLGDITVREDTSAMTEDEMVDSLVNYDVVLPTLGDIYSERIFKSCKK